jgi:fibronectin type 3 domain-containing protein
MKITLKILLFGSFILGQLCNPGYCQLTPGPDIIAVAARPSPDSISLRWAPTSLEVWQLGNLNGYRLERYTIARNGSLLPIPERQIVNSSLKPKSEDQWESLVQTDKYAAIAAQALFGERFEIDLAQSDVITIANKIRENEQRFAFALFSADLSPRVAKASGLWYTDTLVTKNEKYLYRVVINAIDTLRGSIFISPDEPYYLPKPRNLEGEFKDRVVSLRWDKSKTVQYTAHIVERSQDGVHFTPTSDTPLVTVSPTASEETAFDYAVDSLQDASQIYHYRVRGITAFGDEGPPSEIVSGKGTITVTQVPYIISVDNNENKSLQLRWDFPHDNNNAIKGFKVERSLDATGGYTSLTSKTLPADTRHFDDKKPQPVNYYRVTAEGLDGNNYPSHAYFAQLIDSIPPSLPKGLEGTATKNGVIHLSWIANKEEDIFGYRVYKSFHTTEEPAQITSAPINTPAFVDTVNLNTLNDAVYYSVMAIDKNQNHSGLSEPLKVKLPDVVKPQPPIFLPIKSTEAGVLLSWLPSASNDVVSYAVYRKGLSNQEWQLIMSKDATPDSVFHHDDRSGDLQKSNYYTVIAIDDSGLESLPAHAVGAGRINNKLQSAVNWQRQIIDEEQNQVTLRWVNRESNIATIRLYRATDSGQPVLWQTLAGDKKETTDSIVPGHHYSYRIMALFHDGTKSFLSSAALVQY